jgi:hypothetical protein
MHRCSQTRSSTNILAAASDGVFLSDITFTGVCIPVQKILRRLTSVRRPRFSVIDGAQALGHRPLNLRRLGADIYLAGTQKWFGGYHPLRIAFASNNEAAMPSEESVGDPLTDFCKSLDNQSLPRYGETVGLVSLITAAGALLYWTEQLPRVGDAWCVRRLNRRKVVASLAATSHAAVCESLGTGSALLRLPGQVRRNNIRRSLAHYGVVASEPLPVFVRLFMPHELISQLVINRLQNVFVRLGDWGSHFSCRRPASSSI